MSLLSIKSLARLAPWLKLAVVLVVLWAVRRALAGAVEQLGDRLGELAPGWLVVAGGCYLAGLLPSAVFWRIVLYALRQPCPWPDVVRAYYIGHLGKYLPGKAAVVALRVALLPRAGASLVRQIASIFAETFSMMAVGMSVAAVLLAPRAGDEPWLVAAVVGLGAVTWLPAWPPLLAWVVRRTQGSRAEGVDLEVELAVLRPVRLLPSWVALAVGWFLQGAALWAVLRAMGAAAPWPATLVSATAAVAVASVVGFYSFIPGGAVVREAVLGELLATELGAADALLAAVVLRVVSLVAELVISIILYLPGGWRSRRAVS